VDGVIQPSELAAAFKSAGVKDEDVPYYTGVAEYRLSHHKKTGDGSLELNESEVRAAFKVGIFDFNTCVTRLMMLGYTPEAALTLTEISNKGVPQAAVAPAFATLADAEAYMRSLGYLLTPPPDPRLLAAEGMLAANGITWTKVTPFPTNLPPAVPPGG
jgi:hypothetical protein